MEIVIDSTPSSSGLKRGAHKAEMDNSESDMEDTLVEKFVKGNLEMWGPTRARSTIQTSCGWSLARTTFARQVGRFGTRNW